MLDYTKIYFLETLFTNIQDLINPDIFVALVCVLGFNYLFVVLNKNIDSFDLESQTGGLNLLLAILTFFLTLMLSSRFNNAFASWKTGYVNVSKFMNCSKKLFSVLISCCGNNISLNNEFLHQFKNMICKYVGYVFYYCTGTNGRIDHVFNRNRFISQEDMQIINNVECKLGMLTRDERDERNNSLDYRYRLPHTNILEANLKKTILLTNMEIDMRNLIHEFILHNKLSGFEETALNGCVTELSTIANELYNIANIPIVHVYNQFLNLCIVIYMIYYTLAMTIAADYYSALWTTPITLILFIGNYVCNQIDTPFGIEKNDIELEIILHNLKTELHFLQKQRQNPVNLALLHLNPSSNNIQTNTQTNIQTEPPKLEFTTDQENNYVKSTTPKDENNTEFV